VGKYLKNRTAVPASKIIPIRFGGTLSNQQDRVYLTVFLFKKLGLKPGLPVTLKIGQMYRQVVLDQVHFNSNTKESLLFVSPDLYAQCQLTAKSAITLKFNYIKNVLSLGPLIGLFTIKSTLAGTAFKGQESSLFALANLSEELSGLVFVFCPEDINWDMSLVTGYVPVAEKLPEQTRADNQSSYATSVWKPIVVPLPDVVYDRLPSRTIEAKPDVIEVKKRLMSIPTCIFFNPMFLDKWETHLVLRKIDEVSAYLPPTKLVETPEDIKTFLQNYQSIFLKPSAGSLGLNIIKITLDRHGKYNYMFRSHDRQTIEGATADFNMLLKLLKPVMGKRSYIVQKDLALARYEKCPFDIRVLVQKNKLGKWCRTKIFARKAAPDSFLSNLSDGAKPKAISKVLNEVFAADFQAPYGLGEEIRQAIRVIPPALERGTGRMWVELGIDLGIDQHGKIWLIEINSKPFRALVSETGSFKLIRRSLMRPLEFAKFLAGYYMHSLKL
jgi:hypothetical protein